jgi:flagellar protein FlaI
MAKLRSKKVEKNKQRGVTVLPSEEKLPDVPQTRRYEILDEYNIIPQTVSVEISWNPNNMETIYIANEPVLSKDEEDLLKRISANMEQIAKSSKFLPDDLSKLTIEGIIESYLRGRKYKLNKRTIDKIKYYIKRNYEGFGPLEPIIRDPMVEDVSCNGVGVPIFVEHKIHGSLRTNVVFDTEKELDSYVVRLAQMCGKEVSMNEPIIDGTFPQGHRIQLTYGSEISTKGSAFTFRLFRETPFTPVELIKYGAATSELATYLWFAVENLKSAMVAGVPGVGKTSTINAMMMFIPSNTKVFSIEETREINILHQNWVATSTRESIYSSSNIDSKNPPIGMFELVKMAMRQRPTYIILGEIRGRESYSLFQAISTGHTAYSTIHADSMDTLVNRLESNPLNIPRVLISALNIVIFNKFVRVGSRNTRKLIEIDEIVGIDQISKEILYNKVFSYDFVEDRQVFSGFSKTLNEIRDAKQLTQAEFDQEFDRRKALLEGMVKNNIIDYTNITRIINIYYKDPETAMRMASGI